MRPTDSVKCPKLPGNASLPAESCVLRSVWKGKGYRNAHMAYPVCASCPLARLRKKQLEAGGWQLDLAAVFGRMLRRLKAEKKARARSGRENLSVE